MKIPKEKVEIEMIFKDINLYRIFKETMSVYKEKAMKKYNLKIIVS